MFRTFFPESERNEINMDIEVLGHTAVFEQAEDGSWGGYAPDLPTILVNGDTLEEAKENMRTGIELWIEEAKADAAHPRSPGLSRQNQKPHITPNPSEEGMKWGFYCCISVHLARMTGED
jgi:predicted RNase H-like HicB family nuclease